MTSRIPGFYRLPVVERRRLLAEATGVALDEIDDALVDGGLPADVADALVENVVGVYALPLAVALNLRVNGRDRVTPMVVEEPSIVAAVSNAARLVRGGGGFVAEADDPVMIAQVELDGVADAQAATGAIREAARELMHGVDRALPRLVSRGGGARGVEVRDLGDGMLVVHLLVDVGEAMGANLLNTAAERVAPRIAELTGGRVGCRILTNLADRRRVRVRAQVPADALAIDGFDGETVREEIIRASRFAERDPYRAATHNKGVLNGIDAVAMATGNDWRAVEAGAHAFAARDGHYGPLSTWRRGDDGALVGELELPLALGVVGGATRVHRAAQLALRLAGIDSAMDLAMLAASAGLAGNLAALRALGTVGIQEGHMRLHARSVAAAAGVDGADLDAVAKAIHAAGDVSTEAARLARARLDR